MGWTGIYECTTRASIVQHLLKQHGKQIVAKRQTGNRLWAVVTPWNDPDGPKGIMLWMLSISGGFWHYKDVHEDMGPYDYDCPVKLLDMADEPRSEWAREWRSKVRKYAAEKAARRRFVKGLRYGDRFTIAGSCGDFAFIRPLTRTFVQGRDRNGKDWKVRISTIEVPEAFLARA